MTEITNYIFIGIIIGLLVVLCWQGWKLHKLKLNYDKTMSLYLMEVEHSEANRDLFNETYNKLSHMQMKYDDWSETNANEPFKFNDDKAKVSGLGSSPLDYDTLKEMFKEED